MNNFERNVERLTMHEALRRGRALQARAMRAFLTAPLRAAARIRDEVVLGAVGWASRAR